MDNAGAKIAPLTALALAHELGVAGSLVMDFMRAEGITRLDEVGAAKIRAAVAASLAADAAQGGAEDRAPVAAAPVKAPGQGQDRPDLRITRVMMSKRTVLAQHPNGNEVVCLVRSTEYLKAGMVLRECLPNGDWQSWAYQGRLPRGLGDMQNFYPNQSHEK